MRCDLAQDVEAHGCSARRLWSRANSRAWPPSLTAVSKSEIPKKNASLIFTVVNVTHATLTYAATDNHDPDGDSNGSSMTVSRR